LQAEALSFHTTWAVLWLWKLCAADIFLELTIVAIFFDKLWVSNEVFSHILLYLFSNYGHSNYKMLFLELFKLLSKKGH
jgi:hypothetical protein